MTWVFKSSYNTAMRENLIAELEDLERRLDHLAEKLAAEKESKEQIPGLRQKLKDLEEKLAQERTAKEGSLKMERAGRAELESKARSLEKDLAKEKRGRRETADRIQTLIKELEEAKVDD